MKIISICSGKGGVGKTTIAANLAMALTMMNRKTAVVDFNLTTPHLGLSLGCYAGSRTLNSYLRGEAGPGEIIFTHPSGLKVVPASLELNSLANMETENIGDSLRKALQDFDYIILDSAPGIGREALLALAACDEAVFVANPYIFSAVDVLKAKSLAERLGFRNAGIVVNRVRGKRYELRIGEIMGFTELPVLAVVPEDEAIQKCANFCALPVIEYPKSKASRAIMGLASAIAGQWQYGKRFF